MTRVLVLLAALFLGGCDWDRMARSIIPEDAEPVINDVYLAVLTGEASPISGRLHPELTTEALTAFLDQTHTTLPPGIPLEYSYVSAQRRSFTTMSTGTSRTLDTVRLISWEDQHFLLRVILFAEADEDWQINHINVVPFDPATVASVPFSAMSVSQKAFTMLGFLVPAFVLATLIASFKTPRIKRRIIWSLLILLGFPVFTMNMTSGDIWLSSPAVRENYISLFSVKVFAAAYTRAGYLAPWLLSVAVPFGALLFWYRVARGGPTRKDDTATRLR